MNLYDELGLGSIVQDKTHIIGVDEVGYGCLAGPLVVCGVSAPKDWWLDGLNDSKKLSEKKRETMRTKILQAIQRKDEDVTYHLTERSNVEIDKQGVAIALKDAYVECFHVLYQAESLIISDGILKFDNLDVDDYDKVSVIKADGKVPAVMAASILAKTYRDEKMKKFHSLHPQYGWNSNVGYGSKKHLQAINSYGPCSLHRMSYAPMKNMNLPGVSE